MQQFALRAKRAIKKVAAVSAGTAMLGATLTGALAQSYTLADYPAPFVRSGQYDMLPVYGATSAGSDISAAWDILAGMASSAVSGSGGSATVVTGGETDEIPLNTTLTRSGFLDSQLEDDDIESFQDTEITFAGKNVDVHDELDLGTLNATVTTPVADTGPRLVTGLSAGDDDYESNVYMEIGRGKISYHYVFDESIKMNDTSTSQPLELSFLGKKLKIVSIVSNTEFKAYVGDEYFMNVGDKVTCVGKTLSLENVGQSAVLVDVDGVKATIDSGGTETVNGCEITVDELFYRTQIESSSATLVVGKDSSESIKDGDSYFGGDDTCSNENPDDPDCWLWDIGELYAGGTSGAAGNIQKLESTGKGPTLGLVNDFAIDDDSDNPPTVGDCINLPNNYASICMDSTNVADTDYNTFEVRYVNSKDLSRTGAGAASQTNEPVIEISAKEGLEEGLVVVGTVMANLGELAATSSTVKTDKIWLHINDTSTGFVDVFYEDPDNNVKWAGTLSPLNNMTKNNMTMKFGEINFDNTKGTNIQLNLQKQNFIGSYPDGYKIVLDTQGEEGFPNQNAVDDLAIHLSNSTTAFNGMGTTVEQSEAGELVWSWSSGVQKTLGTKDEDHRTLYGIIIKDPDSSLGSDTVTLEVPSDQVKVNVVVKGTSTTVSSGAGAAVAATAPPMVKDNEVSVPENDNLLLVGGPAVNKLTGRFLGTTWTYRPGEAVISLKANGAKVALVVAGTDAIDTQRAGRVLRDYKLYKSRLTGSMVKVTGTSSTFTDTVVQAA